MPENPISDEALVKIIRESDKELYAEIVRRYQLKLTHYLRKFIAQPDKLEDVLQEVFIKAYRNLYAFDIDKKFSPWIYRITHNEAVNCLKKYRNEIIFLDESEMEIIDEKIDVKDKIDQSLLKKKITQGLSLLKEKYREPLILYFFEQRTYEEISDILRIPVSTVGTLIHRGKTMLKDTLQQ